MFCPIFGDNRLVPGTLQHLLHLSQGWPSSRAAWVNKLPYSSFLAAVVRQQLPRSPEIHILLHPSHLPFPPFLVCPQTLLSPYPSLPPRLFLPSLLSNKLSCLLDRHPMASGAPIVALRMCTHKCKPSSPLAYEGTVEIPGPSGREGR
jgi:hypothetical protein